MVKLNILQSDLVWRWKTFAKSQKITKTCDRIGEHFSAWATFARHSRLAFQPQWGNFKSGCYFSWRQSKAT